MDLTANTYQTGRGIYNALVKNIDTLDNFAGRRWHGTIVSKKIYDKKELEIAIPKVKISQDQKRGLDEAIQYAKTKNIRVKITIIE